MCHVGDEKGYKVELDGTKLLNEEIIKSLEGKSCKYLGALEADEVRANEMKDKVEKFYRRARKVLETKLNSRNVFKAINTWAVTVVSYSATFLG